MENKNDVIIIGGGIIGASIARELSKFDLKIITLEANARVALETTGGNSGLVHGGFDPTPGKLNAKLNQLGKLRYEDWINDLEFPYLRIDSTIVAFSEDEMKHVHMLYDRGLKNGLDKKELEVISSSELQKREPNISKEAVGALVCNSSIAVDPVELTKTLFANAIKNGLTLKLNSKVIEIKKNKDEFIVKTSKGDTFSSKIIINAAGHYADEIAKMAGYPDYQLITRRGEYRILEKTESGIVNSVVFMVPTIHGKGVIVAPMLDGHVMVGPTAVEGVDKNETRLVTKEQFDAIGEIGKKLIPSINMNKTCMTYSGSRPIWADKDDFYIQKAKEDENFINVAGMKSPAIAAAPAIADYVIDMIKDSGKVKLNRKDKWDPKQKAYIPIV